ncbi:hypothetical protein [Krasilnikovia sp. MM14-A1259]|uniref:hypothetical protein n=1 Tax=Krasilnikovia sp. MM14-A1259 TaxID=3373539 RepID=UPI00380A83E0
MSIAEEDLRTVRNKPEYKAGVWAFRVMLVALVVNVALWATDMRLLRLLLMLTYLTAVFYGLLQFDRAGMRVSGWSKGVWRRRKVVYRDVIMIGRR